MEGKKKKSPFEIDINVNMLCLGIRREDTLHQRVSPVNLEILAAVSNKVEYLQVVPLLLKLPGKMTPMQKL